MQILYITSFIPKKNADQAGINVSFDIIKTIKENVECKIDLIGLVNENQYKIEDMKDVKEYVEEIEFLRTTKIQKIKNVVTNLSKPPIAAVRYDKRLIEVIKKMCSKNKYDYVICDYTQNSAYGYVVKSISSTTKTILIEHDVCFQGLERKMHLCNNLIKKYIIKSQYSKLKRYETKCIKDFDFVITLNHKDGKIISEYGEVHILNPYINIMNLDKKEHEGVNLMFWGAMNRIENEDAVMYFISEIWPYVNKENVKFYIVGANPTDEVKKLASDNIVVTGFVENPKDIFENMDISVVPLRLGAGVKIKVLESLASGLPVITTDVGAEGIIAQNGRDILIENDPKKFAEILNKLISDEDRRKIISDNGRSTIENNYSKGYNSEVLKSILIN
ncbi:MAG: glycosyltransferase [Clostridium saudiense]|uniref:glycosyltransferase n=1 Tax=Clostridium saudiense TaxID=1414720 RepID=UPI00290E96EA|nr:glycosyltransferase [Clostridium saudiense]MDU3522497.1 glycosyltransferase [Clostridium saudiense]